MVVVTHGSPGCPMAKPPTETSLWVGVLCNVKYLLNHGSIHFYVFCQKVASFSFILAHVRELKYVLGSLFALSWQTGAAPPLTWPLKTETFSPSYHFSAFPEKYVFICYVSLLRTKNRQCCLCIITTHRNMSFSKYNRAHRHFHCCCPIPGLWV